jgi:hypothetical protein
MSFIRPALICSIFLIAAAQQPTINSKGVVNGSQLGEPETLYRVLSGTSLDGADDSDRHFSDLGSRDEWPPLDGCGMLGDLDGVVGTFPRPWHPKNAVTV